jgi:hypothetical protein
MSGPRSGIEVPGPVTLLELAKASPDRKTAWETAFHEAGHVVTEVVLCNSYPDSVYINDDPGDNSHAGRTVTRSFLAVILPQRRWQGDVEPEIAAKFAAWLATHAEHYGTMLAAGEVARHLALGWDVEADDLASCVVFEEEEGADAQALLSVAQRFSRDLLEWVAERYRQAEQVLTEHWENVRTVAGALIQHRRLEREELWELIPSSIAARQKLG